LQKVPTNKNLFSNNFGMGGYQKNAEFDAEFEAKKFTQRKL
jgi:hypothetical protein